ncbi:trace amine-associated receptor 4-like [Stylophora pistillata]|uniref:trace amine-associated receptor 4-like n=1 Tax=Stylophora pistillata TaxID=50429 RepID=UPI000C03E8D0|nr:trace amine-associated receptor 4-like [Stylophora pistillata]XP_022781048.1 trace amine-associated receptor 4-like [Stylophora pistillata]
MSEDADSDIDAKKLEFFWGPVPEYFWVLSAINGLITLICNGVVIFIILKRGRLNRNPCNWLLLSLAFSDLAVGIIMIPSLFLCYFSTVPCDWKVNKIVYDLFLYISVTNLCFLTMDRYIAVVFPLKYTLLIPRKSIIKLIVTAWLFPLVVCGVSFVINMLSIAESSKQLVEHVFVVIKVATFELLPCALMLLAYIHIFQIRRRHARLINSLHRSLRTRSDSIGRETKWRAKATIKVFCVVVPLFVICWTMASWREICSAFNRCSIPPTAVHISRLLLKGHSMIDPIVYALHKKDIRKELFKTAGMSHRLALDIRPRSFRIGSEHS